METGSACSLHDAAAAFVFVKHLALHSGSPDVTQPKFRPRELSVFAYRLLKSGRRPPPADPNLDGNLDSRSFVGDTAVCRGLRGTHFRLVVVEDGGNDDSDALLELKGVGDDNKAESVFAAIQEQIARSVEEQLREFIGAAEAHRNHVQSVVDAIVEVFLSHAGDSGDKLFGCLRQTRVVHPAELWPEDWAVAYMTVWQANGSENSLLCPPVFMWEDAHFRYLASRMGDSPGGVHRAVILLQQFIDTFLVPSHEVVHIAQHFAQLFDSEPTSYSSEHDACALNLPLLWLALHQHRPADGSTSLFPSVESVEAFAHACMLQCINKALVGREFIRDSMPKPDVVLKAYREWADSFGLISPSPTLQREVFPEVEDGAAAAFRLESNFKWMVSADGLAAEGLRRNTASERKFIPTPEHFKALLGIAFHPHRYGQDLYSDANRAVCDPTGTALEVLEDGWRELLSPVSATLSS